MCNFKLCPFHCIIVDILKPMQEGCLFDVILVPKDDNLNYENENVAVLRKCIPRKSTHQGSLGADIKSTLLELTAMRLY